MSNIENGILFFNSTWCGPCKQVKKYLTEDLIRELNITSLDANENMEEFTQYQVASVPTFIKVVNGKEEARKSGALSLEQLKAL